MINVGDMVFWYGKEASMKRTGQVISIDGENASILCNKDKKVYIVPLNRLVKI